MPLEDQFMREAVYVAASQTNANVSIKKGGTISRIIIVPATLAPGIVSFRDGSTGPIRTIFIGGAVVDLKPFVVELNIRGGDLSGFKATTGANVSIIVVGRFNTN